MTFHLQHRLRRVLGITALGIATVVVPACVTTVRSPAGYTTVVDDDGVYYEYETYPRYVYNGTYVYLVGDRWYYHSPAGWSYYVTEPPDLWVYRRNYYRRYGYTRPPHYGAPPAYRGSYAPPAYRGSGAPPAYRGGRAPSAYGPTSRPQPAPPPSHGPAYGSGGGSAPGVPPSSYRPMPPPAQPPTVQKKRNQGPHAPTQRQAPPPR